MEIIIRGKAKFGKSRSEHEENLKKEGWGGSLDEGQLDKCKFLEKKAKEKFGTKEIFPDQKQIDGADKIGGRQVLPPTSKGGT